MKDGDMLSNETHGHSATTLMNLSPISETNPANEITFPANSGEIGTIIILDSDNGTTTHANKGTIKRLVTGPIKETSLKVNKMMGKVPKNASTEQPNNCPARTHKCFKGPDGCIFL